MTINRNNYELYFIDYLDGNLSDRDIFMLEDFLLLNPDLREELEGTEKIHLTPESVEFINKEYLKRADLSLPVNEFNFEDFCVAENEGDLSDLQRSLLKEYIKNHQELSPTYKLFSRLRLVSDKSITFSGKEKLKKAVFFIPREVLVPVLSVAAAIALMIILFFNNEIFERNVPVMTADIPAITIPNSEQENTENGQTPKKQIKSNIQNAAVLAVSSPDEKKKSRTIKKADPAVKKTDDTKTKDVLPPQRLNPSFQIKLPSVADNQILVPAIERGKVTYNAGKAIKATSPEYLSLSEYARKQLSEKVLGNRERANTHITAWQIADAGISGINRITGSEMKLERSTDEDGSTSAYSFNSKLLSFSTTSVK
jgi:hypothetical protein